MRQMITDSGLASDGIAIDYYTAPDTVPGGLDGTYDSVISAAEVLKDLQGRWSEWDGVSFPDFRR